jgi:transcription elongation factor SPT6
LLLLRDNRYWRFDLRQTVVVQSWTKIPAYITHKNPSEATITTKILIDPFIHSFIMSSSNTDKPKKKLLSQKKKRSPTEEEDEDDDDEEDEVTALPVAKKRKKQPSFIDDAAEESGEEDGGNADDDEEDDDEDLDDYVKDGFIVDEVEEEAVTKEKTDDLEDSDDEDEDDEEEEDVEDEKKSRLKKVRKMKGRLDLLEEDLELIQEARRGERDEEDEIVSEPERKAPREHIVAKSEDELRKGLFTDSGDEEQQDKPRKPTRVIDRYDEDGMDDFIEDDIGDQEAIRMSDRKPGIYDEDAREINEAQLVEASEIFGTDYLDFMQADEEPDEEEEDLMGKKFRERGVGVSYGVDSDEEIISDDEDADDLFGDEDEDMLDSETAQQKAEALKLKREKRKLDKAERRKQAALKKAERRKAQLRRAFEPVQLVENFCTERDDEIRQTDVPERYFDWKVPFHGSEAEGMTEAEEEEATWIANRIPAISSELALAEEGNQEKKKAILQSITNALRFMHRDKLEPAFIKRYRRDYVTSPAVNENLYSIMDEDGEYDRVVSARKKVADLLRSILKYAETEESAGLDTEELNKLHEDLQDAERKLDETAEQEKQIKAKLEALQADDDDDDELFGDDDDDEVRFFIEFTVNRFPLRKGLFKMFVVP